MDKFGIEIAKLIGAPIDANLPARIEMSEICDMDTAQPGEPVYLFTGEDGNGVDKVYAVDTTNGHILTIKVSLTEPTALQFTHLNSKLEYVLLPDILGTNAMVNTKTGTDQGALARRKNAITRSMDKKELKMALDAILAVSSQEVAQTSGMDIYDLIKAMVRKIEDYSTDYVLLCGTTCWAEIADYDKKNADTFNYNVTIDKMLEQEGIKKMKVVGNIQSRDAGDTTGNNLPMLAVDKMILVGRNSSLAEGKPLVFVRRLITDVIAQQAGAQVDAKERALFVSEAPSVLDASTQTIGYGVYGYESVVLAVKNYRALAWATFA